MSLAAKDFLKPDRPPDLMCDSLLVAELFLMDPKESPFDVAAKMGGTLTYLEPLYTMLVFAMSI